ncbi:hypothetical protein M2324_003283 [Rhodovulum sulfidophilum]|uniref:hypothetical protein n=1 Tax=Rhodovulum sulfidophilum TaxID=35806 RepID=UPI0006968618|nr:hypothetical protein [Rhodovulum sulfidophilum]ANB33468.1 hypothetical protein A6W98_04915 [Rhodovulum sulfidophilum DSM 1374]ANB37289.1 hypothetical protein A6024_04765 [Rhodovulum sulfidophilum]MCW2304869.1 hypothetical protein [Rhodovulum sulfidophilum]
MSGIGLSFLHGAIDQFGDGFAESLVGGLFDRLRKGVRGPADTAAASLPLGHQLAAGGTDPGFGGRLKAAAQIQPPADDASPLIRAVFAHAVGRQALAEGWAPELLDDLRHNRRWPRSYALGQIRQAAGEALRRHAHLAGAGPGQLSPAEAAWLRDREARLAHCRSIADLAGASA